MNFSEQKEAAFNKFLADEKEKLAGKKTLKIDLHCHDYNSDVPDEILGRILDIPETWLPTDKLMASLHERGCNAFTITNHNNARSCYELQDKGIDILTGAEFSCYVPEFKTGIHVLAYGFSPDEEVALNKKRKNLYNFLEYANGRDIPVIWAHPLYYYSPKGIPPIEFFEKMSLVFERFEVINGQRDTWQNILTVQWIQSLTPQKILDLSKKFQISPEQYCRNPFKKSMSGGSDSHMGIFSGLTGSYLILPEKYNNALPTSMLALNAIREGNISPFGAPNENEKMTAAFLDYFAQIAMNMKDPGLLRILLHKGDAKDKLLGFLITNAFAELKRHKKTERFLKIFHDCFQGVVPANAKKIFIKKDYKAIFDSVREIAVTRRDNSEKLPDVFQNAFENMFSELNHIFFKRLQKKDIEKKLAKNIPAKGITDFIESLELLSVFRSYTPGDKKQKQKFSLTGFLDDLSFPLLSSVVIYGASYTSTRVLYNNRPLLESFSENSGMLQHPQRMLWLTDTFEDKNGVSFSLGHMLQEIQKKNLPIDILVCSDMIKAQDHLIVVKPMFKFRIPFYNDQEMRIPNILEIHEMFRKGGYDRIMCSTEGIMGIISIILKSAYTVPASFFVHTDWLVYLKKSLGLDVHMMNRARRFLRLFYRQFDNIFVLNKEQKKSFSGKDFGIPGEKIHLTSHWLAPGFGDNHNPEFQSLKKNDNEKILLYAGRISNEKGTDDLVEIYDKLKSEITGLRLVIAGIGPELEFLKEKIPDAVFTGWMNQKNLVSLFHNSDLLILPSRFDTFGRVIIEAFSCGLPVISYNGKGPGDIIQNEKTGYLVENKAEMAVKIIEYFRKNKKESLRKNCIARAQDYTPDRILDRFLADIGLESHITNKNETVTGN